MTSDKWQGSAALDGGGGEAGGRLKEDEARPLCVGRWWRVAERPLRNRRDPGTSEGGCNSEQDGEKRIDCPRWEWILEV